jgi:hypothetical protein
MLKPSKGVREKKRGREKERGREKKRGREGKNTLNYLCQISLYCE